MTTQELQRIEQSIKALDRKAATTDRMIEEFEAEVVQSKKSAAAARARAKTLQRRFRAASA